jgi:hypothetical protein
MVRFLSFFFGFTMSGTVDQVDGYTVIAELIAKDGHSHEVNLPLWVFPCRVHEGTRFWINVKNDSTTFYCECK